MSNDSENLADVGAAMHEVISRLYPIPRSITGDGVRRTLGVLREIVPLEVHEVATGTPVFDWTVPNEWNVREAYIADSSGKRVVDFARHSLHLVGYSAAVRKRMSLSELRPHLHTLPDKPDLIPYRTSYYNATWGFCLSHKQLLAMSEGEYEVVIDATLGGGHLTYGEHFIPGETADEILFSAHTCHPQLANDNLSGVVIAAFLARHLANLPRRRHSFRFVWGPGTIGAVTWLARNEEKARRIKAGLILSCLGDGRTFTYKRSRRGNASVDLAVEHTLASRGQAHRLMDFSPYGYDERQYCSPGFNLPVGLLMNSQYGAFPEYHTSADDLSLVTAGALERSLHVVLEVIDVLEHDRRYVNLQPKCEPQLGRRGLYSAVGGHSSPKQFELAMLWVLNQSDGGPSLLEIARRAELPFAVIRDAAVALEKAKLIEELPA